jgi:hypothetical protein
LLLIRQRDLNVPWKVSSMTVRTVIGMRFITIPNSVTHEDFARRFRQTNLIGEERLAGYVHRSEASKRLDFETA